MILYSILLILMENALNVKTDSKLFTLNNGVKQVKFEY